MPRGRGRGSGKSTRGRVTKGALKTRLHGRVFSPPADPPSLVDKPWNSAVIIVGGTGDYKVTPVEVTSALLNQLGLVKTQTIEMRFLDTRVWALSVSRPIRVEWYGITAGYCPVACSQDYGTPTTFPRVGYTWSTSHQAIVYKGDAKDPIYAVDVGSDTKGKPIQWMSYANLLWRSDQYAPLTVREDVCERFATLACSSSASSSSYSSP